MAQCLLWQNGTPCPKTSPYLGLSENHPPSIIAFPNNFLKASVNILLFVGCAAIFSQNKSSLWKMKTTNDLGQKPFALRIHSTQV